MIPALEALGGGWTNTRTDDRPLKRPGSDGRSGSKTFPINHCNNAVRSSSPRPAGLRRPARQDSAEVGTGFNPPLNQVATQENGTRGTGGHLKLFGQGPEAKQSGRVAPEEQADAPRRRRGSNSSSSARPPAPGWFYRRRTLRGVLPGGAQVAGHESAHFHSQILGRPDSVQKPLCQRNSAASCPGKQCDFSLVVLSCRQVSRNRGRRGERGGSGLRRRVSNLNRTGVEANQACGQTSPSRVPFRILGTPWRLDSPDPSGIAQPPPLDSPPRSIARQRVLRGGS